jgi:hypothetical protein
MLRRTTCNNTRCQRPGCWHKNDKQFSSFAGKHRIVPFWPLEDVATCDTHRYSDTRPRVCMLHSSHRCQHSSKLPYPWGTETWTGNQHGQAPHSGAGNVDLASKHLQIKANSGSGVRPTRCWPQIDISLFTRVWFELFQYNAGEEYMNLPYLKLRPSIPFKGYKVLVTGKMAASAWLLTQYKLSCAQQ